MNKKIFLRVLYILLGLTVVGSAIAYFVLPENLGLFVVLCGAVLVVNFLISIFFVNKNFRN
ncbi:MAG: hypothetical protein ACRCX5_00585 [Bacteroidales bacterium]